jgi:hypothetical protein
LFGGWGRGKKSIFTALKVRRQCPLVVIVKVGRKQGEAFGSEERSALGVNFLEFAAGLWCQ